MAAAVKAAAHGGDGAGGGGMAWRGWRHQSIYYGK
jgi:hypothetical protein